MSQDESKPMTVEQQVQTGLNLASIAGNPAGMLFRAWGSEGIDIFGGWAFATTLIPLLTDGVGSQDPMATYEPHFPTGLLASGSLVALFIARKAAAQKNRGKMGTRDLGYTIGCKGPRPAVELAYGIGLGLLLSFLGAEALGGLLILSSLANAIDIKAVFMRQEAEAKAAGDAFFAGKIISRDMDNYRP